MFISGDFDLDKNYFKDIPTSNFHFDEFFNYFYLTPDNFCSAYVFDGCWKEFVPVPGNDVWQPRYHPFVRKKADFVYDANTPRLAAIFSRLDPAWFSPYKTMIHHYTFDDVSPRSSTRTFIENTSRSYTDSIFTFNKDDVKSFYSVKRIDNAVTLDAKDRVVVMENQGDVELRERYEFFYKE